MDALLDNPENIEYTLEALYNDKANLVTTILSEGSKIGVFSNILVSLPIILYDQDQLIESFPQGFITENALFISADYYKKVGSIKNEDGLYINKKNLSALVFINAIIDLLSHQFSVRFNAEEQVDIVVKTQKKANDKTTLNLLLNDNTVNIEIKKFPFVALHKLLEILKPLRLPNIDKIEELGTKCDYLVECLFKSKEIYNMENPLSKLMQSVHDRKLKEHKFSLSVDEYYDSLISYNPNKKKLALDAIVSMSGKIVNKTSSLPEFIEEAQIKWMPFLDNMKAPELTYVLSELHNKLTKKYVGIKSASKPHAISSSNYINNSDESIAFIQEIVGHTDENGRSIAINIFTNFYMINNDSFIKDLEKENIKQQAKLNMKKKELEPIEEEEFD